MGESTGISWTDATFNPVWGCTKVSPGCDHCYAETFDKRVGGNHWGKGAPRRLFGDAHWNEPLKWNKKAENEGRTLKVFCGSMCDVMDDEWPEGVRERLWDLIDATPYLIWQLLTKRPHRYNRYLPNQFAHDNVWLGTTAENQDFYDVRWPILSTVCRDYKLTSWISYEPALGPLTMYNVAWESDTPDWIIFGGESGAGRRPMQPEWAENLLAECRNTGTKFFMKQYGARTPEEGKKLIPARMLIHEFPGEKG